MLQRWRIDDRLQGACVFLPLTRHSVCVLARQRRSTRTAAGSRLQPARSQLTTPPGPWAAAASWAPDSVCYSSGTQWAYTEREIRGRLRATHSLKVWGQSSIIRGSPWHLQKPSPPWGRRSWAAAPGRWKERTQPRWWIKRRRGQERGRAGKLRKSCRVSASYRGKLCNGEENVTTVEHKDKNIKAMNSWPTLGHCRGSLAESQWRNRLQIKSE